MSSRLPRNEALEKEDRIDEMEKKKQKKNSPSVPHLLLAQQAIKKTFIGSVGKLETRFFFFFFQVNKHNMHPTKDFLNKICYNLDVNAAE